MLQLDAVGLLGHLSQAVGGAVDMGVAPLFAGPYKLRFSLWGFTWNNGRRDDGAIARTPRAGDHHLAHAMRRAYVAVLTSPDFLERHDASRS